MLITKKNNGFTLVEVMITVVIIGLLAAIAYPSYQNSVTKSRRAEAKAALLDLQNRMERVYIDYSDYRSACITTHGGSSCQNLGANPPQVEVLSSNRTENEFYNLVIDNSTTQTTFSIRAEPQGAQATNDAECKNFTLNHQGVKGISGTGTATDCW